MTLWIRSSNVLVTILLVEVFGVNAVQAKFSGIELVNTFLSPSVRAASTTVGNRTNYQEFQTISSSRRYPRRSISEQEQYNKQLRSTNVSKYKDVISNRAGDSLEKFSRDIKKVLKELRPTEIDSAIPAIYRSRKPSFTTIWDSNDWKIHTSRWRYVRYLVDFPTSRLMKRTFPQMIVLFIWSCIAVVLGMNDMLVGKVQIGLTPLSLVSTFVAALLTLRSNQGLSRLYEARSAFGNVILQTREMGQLIGAHVYPNDEQLGLLAARHVTLFGWCLKAHIRESLDTVSDIVSTMLPSPKDAQYITSYRRKAPAAIVLRLRSIIDNLVKNHKLDREVQTALFHTIFKLNEALMISEKIRNSPLPPMYTAHASRLLIFYLFWLPLALYGSFQDCYVTLLVTLAAGYAMFGLDEISHILENPFVFMPLHQLSKMSMTDAADAIVYRPPSLFGDETLSSYDEKSPENWTSNATVIPEYW